MELSSTERRMFQAESATETEVEKHRIYPDKFAAHCERQSCVGKLVLVTQSSPTLCNPRDCNPPSSSVHRILQEYWCGLPFPSVPLISDLR